jgi:hypothetical protein
MIIDDNKLPSSEIDISSFSSVALWLGAEKKVTIISPLQKYYISVLLKAEYSRRESQARSRHVAKFTYFTA